MVDMSLIKTVIQIRNGQTFIPTILAETLRTLTFYKHRGKGFFIANVGLLQIWLISHLVQGSCTSQGFMHCNIIKLLNRLSPTYSSKGEMVRVFGTTGRSRHSVVFGLGLFLVNPSSDSGAHIYPLIKHIRCHTLCPRLSAQAI